MAHFVTQTKTNGRIIPKPSNRKYRICINPLFTFPSQVRVMVMSNSLDLTICINHNKYEIIEIDLVPSTIVSFALAKDFDLYLSIIT